MTHLTQARAFVRTWSGQPRRIIESKQCTDALYSHFVTDIFPFLREDTHSSEPGFIAYHQLKRRYVLDSKNSSRDKRDNSLTSNFLFMMFKMNASKEEAFTDAQLIGILANLFSEGSADPAIWEGASLWKYTNHPPVSRPAFGLWQFSNETAIDYVKFVVDLKADLFRWSDLINPLMQFTFVKHQINNDSSMRRHMTHGYIKAYHKDFDFGNWFSLPSQPGTKCSNGLTSAQNAAAIFMICYEKPSLQKYSNIAYRTRLCGTIFNEITKIQTA